MSDQPIHSFDDARTRVSLGADSPTRLERHSEPAATAPAESGPEAAGEPTCNSLHDLALFVPHRVPTLTNSPGASPSSLARRTPAPLRRVLPVRVDAWSTPASATWTRTRKSVRKVNRQPHSTNWALPF